MDWGVFTAATSGASIEFLETAAIAYAIARSGYPREAVWGSFAGIGLVTLAAITLGTSLQFIPVRGLQTIIGLVLIWFGWGWANKSLQRQATRQRAGWMADDPLVNEGISLDMQQEGFNPLNFLVMTKSAALEAVEVAIIVTTLGAASGSWYEVLSATLMALLGSFILVATLHRYLLNIPEVLIKLVTGILLCALGTFWLGAGLGLEWWFGELAVVGILALYGLITTLAFCG
ncbi:MAG: COG4280 domain-containing protein [Leptolyngbyaceae cyanobacterium CRU_2_3]|nr:COG4280 domain-containing protein [Leptolyngbyaceae cyanobacterium CRU_2_3]